MIVSSLVYTGLRLLSAALLTATVILMIIMNTAPLGEVRAKLISVSLYYHLWYFRISLFPNELQSYSPDAMVACRVLVIVAILAAIASLGVVVYGAGSFCSRNRITHRTNLLLYISLSLSFLVVLMLIAFLITFGVYFHTENPNSSRYWRSEVMNEVAATSWQGGMHCAIAATVLCVSSFMLDFLILRMSLMMEKYAADAEAANSPDNKECSQQAGG